MKRIENFISKYLMPIANYVSSNKEINAIKDGMLQVMPLMMIGSFMLIIANFPFIDQLLPGVDLWSFFGKGYEATMGITALAALMTISYNYSLARKSTGMYGALTALVSYMVLTDFSLVVDKSSVGGVIPVSVLGGQAVFTVLIVAILSVRIYTILEEKKITIKMPTQVPANVAKSFSSMIPLGIVVLLFLLIRMGFGLTEYGTFHNFIYSVLTKSLIGLVDFKYSIVLIAMLGSFLWFFGIHGGIIVVAIFGPIMDSMTIANADAFAQGKEIPYIASTLFYNTYAVAAAMWILSAILACLIVGKSKQTKAVSKLSIIPAIFNIQEPFHFGFPTFMNPILFIPYVIIPGVLTFLSFTLVQLNISPMPVMNVPWTTPIIISGFISTNYNIMGAVTQIGLLAVATIMWIPFIKVADKMNLKKEIESESEGTL